MGWPHNIQKLRHLNFCPDRQSCLKKRIYLMGGDLFGIEVQEIGGRRHYMLATSVVRPGPGRRSSGASACSRGVLSNGRAERRPTAGRTSTTASLSRIRIFCFSSTSTHNSRRVPGNGFGREVSDSQLEHAPIHTITSFRLGRRPVGATWRRFREHGGGITPAAGAWLARWHAEKA